MKHWIIGAIAALVATPALAQTSCSTVTVSRATVADIPALQADARCFGEREAAALVAREAAAKLQASARASRKLREARVAALIAETVPPPPTATYKPDPVNAAELAPIASTLSRDAMVVATAEVPHSGAPDIVGAMRVTCLAGQLNYDDAIVYPGKPGASPHLHQWYGNDTGDGRSTYVTLRAKGGSTCGGPGNRSAYWAPAMVDGQGNVVRFDYATNYYKRVPTATCIAQGIQCAALPAGLRMITGYDMRQMGQPQPAALDRISYRCVDPVRNTSGVHRKTLGEALAGCAPGMALMTAVAFPDCWDGKRLDSPDHRAHVAFQVRDPHTGREGCPATHPVRIPQLTQNYSHTVDANAAGWHLASDRMEGMADMVAGTTMHADFMEGWEPSLSAAWHANCIDKLLSCSAGAMGDGTRLIAGMGFELKAVPRIVPVPAR